MTASYSIIVLGSHGLVRFVVQRRFRSTQHLLLASMWFRALILRYGRPEDTWQLFAGAHSGTDPVPASLLVRREDLLPRPPLGPVVSDALAEFQGWETDPMSHHYGVFGPPPDLDRIARRHGFNDWAAVEQQLKARVSHRWLHYHLHF